MDILTTFGSAMAGTKAAIDLLQAIAGATIDNAARAKIHEALSEVMKLNSSLLHTQQYLFELQHQNAELLQELKAHDDFALRKSKYQMRHVGNARVYESMIPDVFVCPSCLETHKDFQFLQGSGTCPRCKYDYDLNPSTGGGFHSDG